MGDGDALDAAALEPRRVQIEITEDMYAGDLPTAQRAMQELKQLLTDSARGADDTDINGSDFHE